MGAIFRSLDPQLINFWWIQKSSHPPQNIHWERCSIQKILFSPISKTDIFFGHHVYEVHRKIFILHFAYGPKNAANDMQKGDELCFRDLVETYIHNSFCLVKSKVNWNKTKRVLILIVYKPLEMSNICSLFSFHELTMTIQKDGWLIFIWFAFDMNALPVFADWHTRLTTNTVRKTLMFNAIFYFNEIENAIVVIHGGII